MCYRHNQISNKLKMQIEKNSSEATTPHANVVTSQTLRVSLPGTGGDRVRRYRTNMKLEQILHGSDEVSLVSSQ